ncbi:MAG: hypothetical protein LM572_02030 [Ignisphaera sp.]|jgi:hypothetical protein|nr:hypothetical protein [Ignisphaera sp.]MCC6055129.1 hypothetical protein [Desulfurococcaceae archaeon]
MGVEALSEILSHFSVVLNSGSVLARVFAWLGVVLIGIVIIYYVTVGLVKLFKAFWRMNVKYLGLVLFMLGIMFIAISLILPPG